MSYESLTEKLLKGKKEEKFFVSIVPVSPLGEVLLGKRTEDGIWTTPGGGAEPGEEPHDAARRELFEEAGLAAPANALELVNIGETPRGFKIYSFLWRMPQVMAEIATPKLDPDKEVKSWKLYRPENFPASMASEENASRLKTIREALMRLYAVKSEQDLNVISLITKLKKGGPGSGKRGHITNHPQYNKDDHAHLKGKGYSDSEITAIWDRDHKDQKKPVGGKVKAPDAVGVAGGNKDAQRASNMAETHRQMVHTMNEANSPKKIKKGGPGSGMEGHVSIKQPSHLHALVNSNPAKPVNKLQSHLMSLEHGGVIHGLQTKSGKPVVNNMDHAKAHGYDVQDHVDAMNAHYELAHKTQAMLDKLKMAGHKVPAEGAKIAKFHQSKMKEHMKARQYLENRKQHTDEAVKEKKASAVASVKKSVTQMGSGLGDRDLDVGSFAQANGQGHTEWMERLYTGMEGYSFGDDPRSFETPKGTLHLTKVDDGIYSGYFTKIEESLEDNAKIRIERITIPELVQLMIAKEWIYNHMIEPQAPEESPVDYATAYNAVADQIAQQEKEADYAALQNALTNPSEVPMNGPMDQKIKLLELIHKLLS